MDNNPQAPNTIHNENLPSQTPILIPSKVLPPKTSPAVTPPSYPEPVSYNRRPIITIYVIFIFILFVLGGTLSYLIPKLTKPQNQVVQKESVIPTIVTPTPTAATIAIPKTKTFANDLIKFSYSETAKQSVVDQDYNFDFSLDNNPTGNFVFYSMSDLGNSISIDSWIAKNEKCGTSTSRKGDPFTTASGITGIRIENLGACPPGGSSVIDSFYFTTGKTIHIFRLHQGGVKKLSREEFSTFISLLNSIVLSTDTTGVK